MKKIIALFISIILIATLFFGCTTKEKETETANNSMFVVVEGKGIDVWRIVYDKDTKVMYAVSSGGYNGGNFTMLVNADGSPKLYKEQSDGTN